LLSDHDQDWSADAPVYFLLHMPRTAGNTIATHLKAHLGEQVWSPVQPSALTMLNRGNDYLGNAPDIRQVRFETGHQLRRSFEKHFPGRDVRRTLLLRDPVGFHLSYYNHRMMFLLSRGGGTCSFDRHFRAQPRDLLPLILLWYWLGLPLATMLSTGDARKYELLNEAIAGFWFVGSYRDCDRLLAALAAELDIPAAAPPRNTTEQWRKRVDWRPLQVDDLSPAMRQAILARNPVHEALWQSWQDAGFNAAGVVPHTFRGSPTGRIGGRDLVRAMLADRAIPPLWQHAARAVKMRDWPRAAALYRKALTRAPGMPDIWMQYGNVLHQSGDLAGAEAAYRRAAELDEDVAEAHLLHGHALFLQGRTEEARQAYLRCERLDPAGLDRRIDELVALGWSKDDVLAFWRSRTQEHAASRPAAAPDKRHASFETVALQPPQDDAFS
jgi:tetratricopeptide (TPR) repeat protein